MSEATAFLNKLHGRNALIWFQKHFYQKIASPIESQFPVWAIPQEIQGVLRRINEVSRGLEGFPGDSIPLDSLLTKLSRQDAELFKRIILLYRRHRAAETEGLIDKTFHLQLTKTLEGEKIALDAVVNAENFSQIGDMRLPRLKDFLPVQFIEAVAATQVPQLPRQFDEKFHVLQAPQLFLPDVNYFRAKCEDRDAPLAIAFVDIDDFKSLNTMHTETKVDRNLLPRFMQAMEAHLFHHGYAYRQGGDEYLVLLPSLSRPLSIGFLDGLRIKLAILPYPDIPEKTTVSIGLCMADSDCPLTDRELREGANRAKQFAKKNGKNCITTYRGRRFDESELEVVSGSAK